MSWLNLNDSLNSIKGQLSNFANNVLADEDDKTGSTQSNEELGELQRLCNKQQEEINLLQKINNELRQEKNSLTFPKSDINQPNGAWSWEVSEATERDKNDEIIADLKRTILELQNDKQELTQNLVLLDSEHQLNNEKLLAMKNKLQDEYNNLEDNYKKLEEENIFLIKDAKRNITEFEDLQHKYESAIQKSTSKLELNNICTKCEGILQENQKLISEVEMLRNEASVLKSDNVTLQKVLNDCKSANDEECAKLNEKVKLCESENKILVAELKKAAQSIKEFEKKSEIDAENCRKLALILDGYEQQVSALKQELFDKSTLSTEDSDKNKDDLEKLQVQLKQAILEKEQTHSKYVNILTENMRRYIDGDKLYEEMRNSENESDAQVLEFNHQVKSLLNILLDLKSKCDSLESELVNVTEEKANIISEKNHEIEKLIQNSEILSQEVITKSQTIKDYENECNELIKNNDILINELKILKNNAGLQTISESNEDNMLLLETQLENANKKIEELEILLAQNENNSNLQTSEEISDYILKSEFNKLLGDYNNVEKENSNLKEDIKKVEESKAQVCGERENLAMSLEKLKTDLENTEYQYTEININTEVLREEIENQKKNIAELTEQKLCLNKLNTELERSNEDIRGELNIVREKLLIEEDARKHSESQIRNLTEKLQNAKMCETTLKLQYDTMNKELSAITEAKCILNSQVENYVSTINKYRDEMEHLQHENEEFKNIIRDLQNKLKEYESSSKKLEEIKLAGTQNIEESTNAELKQENSNLRLQYDLMFKERESLNSEINNLKITIQEHLYCSEEILSLQKQIEELEASKNELANVVITKHQENVTYHNELQRLSQILNSEVEKNRNLEIQLQNFETTINNTEIQKKDEELEKLTDQNNFLRQKCEVLAQNLLEEQSRVQKILSEQSGISEKEQALTRKLERLQTHLIEVEEHYTQELLRAEERNSELQAKVYEIEQREKNSSTMYTSVSIRANQHVETLQHQLQLITNQRDELRRKISDAEDHASKQEAALANLQFVLEQFQKDKDKDVQKETERIRRKIVTEKKIQDELRREIVSLQAQLEETKHGLLAASRLSDQLEQSKQLVTTLKAEVSQLKEKLVKNEDQLKNLSSQSDGKVDKSLIKNLVIGLVTTNNNLNKDQVQILKIIATVLDFNQQDHDKVNLNKSQQGWLGSLLNPQASQGISQESLSQAFVKFLENESKPRLVPSLLNNNGETPKSRKTSTASAPSQSPSILSEMVLPTFADFAQNRNSSSILKDVLKDNS